jgi:hypothetical protein
MADSSLPNPYDSSQTIAPAATASELEALAAVSESDIAAALERLRSQQNFPLAVLAGSGAALAGAGLWLAITVATHLTIGYMAVGVGFLVGYAVRTQGKGLSPMYGVLGATLALLGCMLGNFSSVVVIVANSENETYLDTTLFFLTNPVALGLALVNSFADLLFYGIALYEGYHLSFRQLTEQDALDAMGVK